MQVKYCLNSKLTILNVMGVQGLTCNIATLSRAKCGAKLCEVRLKYSGVQREQWCSLFYITILNFINYNKNGRLRNL